MRTVNGWGEAIDVIDSLHRQARINAGDRCAGPSLMLCERAQRFCRDMRSVGQSQPTSVYVGRNREIHLDGNDWSMTLREAT